MLTLPGVGEVRQQRFFMVLSYRILDLYSAFHRIASEALLVQRPRRKDMPINRETDREKPVISSLVVQKRVIPS